MTQPMDEPMRPYAWHTEDHLTDRSATTYSKDMAYRWECKGWPVVLMYTADQMRAYAEQARKDYSFTHAQTWLKRINDAVQIETEACARMVEPLDGSLADAIRARQEGIQSEHCNCPGFCTGACERSNT